MTGVAQAPLDQLRARVREFERSVENIQGDLGRGRRRLAQRIASELAAAAAGCQDLSSFRKWLGWLLFRLAVRVNPEIEE